MSGCIFDACAVPGKADELICASIEKFAAQCQEAGGDVKGWREKANCRKYTQLSKVAGKNYGS